MPIASVTALALAAASLAATAVSNPDGDPYASEPVGALAAPLEVSTASTGAGPIPGTANADDMGLAQYFADWEAHVEESKAAQPDWVPPLMTLSPLITELVRWDSYYENLGAGSSLLNLGANKGIFLVPTTTNEVDLGIPSYEQRYGSAPASGLADDQFLLVKQRLLSANDQDGDYIITAALSGQAPTGAPAFTTHTFVVTPYLLGGKGFGDLNIQAATGLALPTSREQTLGKTWATNVTTQYRVDPIFWPEIEVNWTRWLGGTQRSGLNQVFVTLGLIAAPIQLTRHLKLAIGAGFQFAVAPAQTYKPAQTPVYRNNFIFTGRVLF